MRQKSDGFTADLFTWLYQVRADSSLPASAFKLAFVIGEYLNRKSRCAWPSIAELAARHGSSRRTVMDSLRRLRSRGHLSVDSGKGRHKFSIYRPIIWGRKTVHSAAPFDSEKVPLASPITDEMVRPAFEIRAKALTKTCSRLHTEPSKEPSDKPFERDPADGAKAVLLGDQAFVKKPRAKSKSLPTQMPDIWPTPEDLAWAERECAAADRHDLVARLPAISEYARDWCLDRGITSANWTARWRNWIRREIRPQGERRAASAQPVSGRHRLAVDGFEDFLVGQRQ